MLGSSLHNCSRAASMSYMQQDVHLLPTLQCLHAARPNSNRAGGQHCSFVELGAYDGITLSNTLMLEKCLGWRGLLIEASRTNFRSLRSSGRKSAKVHSAICNATNGSTVRMAAIPSNGAPKDPTVGELSALAELHNPDGRFMSRFWTKGHPGEIGSVEVPCWPLPTLMERHSFRECDFFSLDVEGSEEQVLHTVDPRRFKLIMVEAAVDTALTARHHRVRSILEGARFQRVARLERNGKPSQGINHVYVRDDALSCVRVSE